MRGICAFAYRVNHNYDVCAFDRKIFIPYAHFMDKEEQKKIAGERIKAFRLELGMKQKPFAEFLGFDEDKQSTISKWEKGRQLPGSEHTARLAQMSGRPPIWFSGLDPVSVNDPESRLFPMVGEIQAGSWKEAIELEPDDRELVALPSALAVPPYVMKAFVVRGTSMDRIYPDGSIVFIATLHQNRITPVHGDIVMVQRQDNHGLYEATLKELVVDEDGRRWLWPRSHDPEHQSPLSIHDGRDPSTDVIILGIVAAAITVPRRRR